MIDIRVRDVRNYMQNPPVALGHKDHMATTRAVACDPTMSQGRWARWACYSKDGVRNNQKYQKTKEGSCGLCPLPTLSLHVQVQIEARTFATRGPFLPFQCQAPAIAVINLSCSVTLRGAGDDDQRQHDSPPAFAPDDARPGRM